EQFGDDLLGVMRDIKRTLDPGNIFNPGKIFEVETSRGDVPRTLSGQRSLPTRIDNHLRENFTRLLELPFEPVLAFAFKDRSFIGNLEQCNGCGGCLKNTGIMCPTFMATHEEVMSTRGRANIIRAALELRVNGRDPLHSTELDAALSNCLSCKGCTPECPSNVNLALLKAELMHARYQRDGLPFREWLFSNVDLLGKIGCAMPSLTNWSLDSKYVRAAMEKTIGLSARRTLPHYTERRFDKWFEKHAVAGGYKRGRVILWDDTFVRYHEPQIGIAAVKVLEALGFEVSLVANRTCCGRPAFSQGNLEAATRSARHNVGVVLSHEASNTPVLFLEPSCWSMFMEDYRELAIDGAEKLANRCFLFEKFVDDLLAREPAALQFRGSSASAEGLRGEKETTIAIHPHCHAKSIMNPEFMKRLAERLPGRKASVLDTACCGMAGAFGALAEKYDLSVQVAQDLIDKLENQGRETQIVASGTSCRHQISDLTDIRPKHMAELLAEALV
ncbi:MAG: 4Fe-4S dicluster domain-containing protein, partial [Verrucomicrobia bacterium]|nr:4Fe-4S dicluster domain-containing protein [Verrucomicrobiota bacterium]